MIFKNRISIWLHRFKLKAEPALSGEWERLNDRFAGCRMRVSFQEPQETGNEAILTYVPPSMTGFGWHPMDLKCKDIRRVGMNRYSALELHKQLDLLTGNTFSYYVPTTMILLSADLLQFRHRPRMDNSVSHTWRRFEE